TIQRDGCHWYITFCIEDHLAAAAANGLPPVGIDRGVVFAVATSDGQCFHGWWVCDLASCGGCATCSGGWRGRRRARIVAAAACARLANPRAATRPVGKHVRSQAIRPLSAYAALALSGCDRSSH